MAFNVKTGILGLRDMDNGDIHYMLNIDRKFSEFPWVFSDWQKLVVDFPEWRINVVTIKDQVCGFCVWETPEDTVRIHRFCYDKRLTEFLVDKVLLAILTGFCRRFDRPSIEYIVRETSCMGADDPYDKSAWLLKQDFRCEEIYTDYFEGYGKRADGFVFRKKIEPALDTDAESDYDEQIE